MGGFTLRRADSFVWPARRDYARRSGRSAAGARKIRDHVVLASRGAGHRASRRVPDDRDFQSNPGANPAGAGSLAGIEEVLFPEWDFDQTRRAGSHAGSGAHSSRDGRCRKEGARQPGSQDPRGPRYFLQRIDCETDRRFQRIGGRADRLRRSGEVPRGDRRTAIHDVSRLHGLQAGILDPGTGNARSAKYS